MLNIQVKLTQDARKVVSLLTRSEDACQNLTPAWEKSITRIQRAFRIGTQRNEEGVGHFGVAAFAALSPQYAAWKARHYPGAPILVQRGTLLRSLTRRKAPGAIREVDPQGFRFGTSVSVGKWNLYEIHSQGLPPVPKRDPTPSQGAVERIVHREILRHLREAVKNR